MPPATELMAHLRSRYGSVTAHFLSLPLPLTPADAHVRYDGTTFGAGAYRRAGNTGSDTFHDYFHHT
jgi:hypothetical protein